MNYSTPYLATSPRASARDAVDRVLLVGARVAMAVVYLYGGASKVLHFSGFCDYLGGMGIPLPALFTTASISVELGLGACLALGFRVRWTAWVIAAFTIGATLIGHPFWQGGAGAENNLLHALKNLAIIGGLLAVSVAQRAVDKRREA